MSFAASTVLALKTGIGISLCLSLFPITSINIPFISYNSTGLFVDLILVGIVLPAWMHNNIIPRSTLMASSASLAAGVARGLSTPRNPGT